VCAVEIQLGADAHRVPMKMVWFSQHCNQIRRIDEDAPH
jgi:hypothetical protein